MRACVSTTGATLMGQAILFLMAHEVLESVLPEGTFSVDYNGNKGNAFLDIHCESMGIEDICARITVAVREAANSVHDVGAEFAWSRLSQALLGQK